MFKNYFKIAIRNLFRNKLYTFINIIGLSVGITCSFLILLNIQDELSYDMFFKNKNRIYRVALQRVYPQNVVEYAFIPASIGTAMENDFPEIEACTRIFNAQGEFILRYEDLEFEERNVCFVDSNFFDMFSIPLLKGDPENVLKDPGALVITESTARKYFGEEEAIGKSLTTPMGEILVSGVCADVPKNSHLQFDFLGALNATGLTLQPNYVSFSVHTYIRLVKGTDTDELEEKFPDLVEQYAAGQIEANMGISYREYTRAGNGYNYFLQPLKSIHLNSNLDGEIKPNGNIMYVYIFISVALFILIIACINFMNLSTARSADRAGEVGMRKVLGSNKKQLVRQFLTESMLITFISLVISVILAELLLPSFNFLAGKQLEISYVNSWITIPLLIVLGLIVGLLAGSYPAFVLSSHPPLSILGGTSDSSPKGVTLRNILVIFQFFISIALISFTLLVDSQIKFFQNKPLGFKKDQIVVINRAFALGPQTETFKERLMSNPRILSVAGSNTEISGGYYFGRFFQIDLQHSEIITSRGMSIDDDFIETMDLEIIEGRGFSKEFDDSLSLIINESAIKEFNLAEPVGAQLYNPDEGTEVAPRYTIVGVVKDFHYNSLHDDIKSFVLFSSQGVFQGIGYLNVNIAEEERAATIEYIEEIWNEFVPDQPFSYFYLDDRLNSLYNTENTSRKIFSIFTVLAIIIACVGLYGLAAFMAKTRTKEVGIRKVLGSSISRIVLLMVVKFARLVTIAFLIAIPAAYFISAKWLQSFAYKTNIDILAFILAGLAALLIAMLTISYQVMKAARTNPADSLRYE